MMIFLKSGRCLYSFSSEFTLWSNFTCYWCGKHVLCESPIAVDFNQTKRLCLVWPMNEGGPTEGIKTAYSTAYQRLLLLIESGKIGRVVSVDATCTSLKSLLTINTQTGLIL